MTLIKIQNVVINNSYVAVVRLDNQTVSDKKSVSVPLATPQVLLFQWDTIPQNILYFGLRLRSVEQLRILDFLVRPPLIVGVTNLAIANANLKLQI